MSDKNIIIAAGGTGGHMFPAAAFASEMQRRGFRCHLITDIRGERYAKDFAYDSVTLINAATFASKRPDKLVGAALKIAQGYFAARSKLKALQPTLVAGFGGYPAFPAMLAAGHKGHNTIIHEQNAVLGRVNRVFVGGARFIASGFGRLDRLKPKYRSKHHALGNPVREDIYKVRDKPYPETEGKLTILAIGGSQGARRFGEVIGPAFEQLSEAQREGIHLIQQVREEQLEALKTKYQAIKISAELAPFFSDMAGLYEKSHLVISRAGASSVSELQVTGRPAILVPLGIAMDDHQTANAESLVEAGGAELLSEEEFTPHRLAELLKTFIAEKSKLEVYAGKARVLGEGNAAIKLADLAVKLL